MFKKILFILILPFFLYAQWTDPRPKSIQLWHLNTSFFDSLGNVVSDSIAALSADGVTITNSGGTFKQVVFADTAALKAVSGSEGNIAVLAQLGVSGAGGGTFVWRTSALTPDGGNVFGATGGYWVRASWLSDRVYKITDFGAVGDSTTDNTDAVIRTLQAAYNNGGGEIYVPQGQYLIEGRIKIPNNGAAIPEQPTISIRGSGSHSYGKANPDPRGGSVWDMTWESNDSTQAKIYTNGFGWLTFDGMTFKDSGTDSTTFILTTNTALNIQRCSFYGTVEGATAAQNAIMLGGNATTATYDSTNISSFQGYVTVIADNFFNSIENAVLLQRSANGVVIQNNWFGHSCGGEAALKFDAPVNGLIAGGYVSGNVWETNQYEYGVMCANRTENIMFIGNSFYDASDDVKYIYYFGTTTKNNFVLDALPGYGEADMDGQYYDPTGKNNFINTTSGGGDWGRLVNKMQFGAVGVVNGQIRFANTVDSTINIGILGTDRLHITDGESTHQLQIYNLDATKDRWFITNSELGGDIVISRANATNLDNMGIIATKTSIGPTYTFLDSTLNVNGSMYVAGNAKFGADINAQDFTVGQAVGSGDSGSVVMYRYINNTTATEMGRITSRLRPVAGASPADILFMTGDNFWYKGKIVFRTNNVDGSSPASPPTPAMVINPDKSINLHSVDNTDTLTIYNDTSDRLRVTNLSDVILEPTNYVGIKNTSPNNALDVTGTVEATAFKLNALQTAPSSAADTGTTGEIRIDSNYIYVCVATNTWKRVEILTW